MTRANSSKWMCVLAFVLMAIPAIVSVGQAAAAPGAADRTVSSTDAGSRGSAIELIPGPRGFCPSTCNSSAQCTTGCKTEALCINHHCTPL